MDPISSILQSYQSRRSTDNDVFGGSVTSGYRKRKRRKQISPPTLLIGIPTSTTVDLNWVASQGLYVDKYEVYRNGVSIGETTTTEFTDTGLSPSTEYNYYVVASNRFGGVAMSGTTTVNTIESAPNPWVEVASEGQTITFTVQVDVAYGFAVDGSEPAPSAYLYNVTGAVEFSNSFFGSALFGPVKKGWFRLASPP